MIGNGTWQTCRVCPCSSTCLCMPCTHPLLCHAPIYLACNASSMWLGSNLELPRHPMGVSFRHIGVCYSEDFRAAICSSHCRVSGRGCIHPSAHARIHPFVGSAVCWSPCDVVTAQVSDAIHDAGFHVEPDLSDRKLQKKVRCDGSDQLRC